MKTFLIIILSLFLFSCKESFTLSKNHGQDYIKGPDGKWHKLGEPYKIPDTVTTIHVYRFEK